MRTTLATYLQRLEESSPSSGLAEQRSAIEAGRRLYLSLDPAERDAVLAEFASRVRTEELKAWYGAPEEPDSLFQGTSISSLTVPCETERPLRLSGIEALEEAIAEHYVRLHDRHAETVRRSIVEDVESWLDEGLYYGVALPSKLVSQAFDLRVPYNDVVFDVDGHRVDPHEITHYPEAVREAYFNRAVERLECFEGLDLDRRELESSLILADISKPRIEDYRDNILLAPVRCNEIAALMAGRLRALITECSAGRIHPPSLNVVIYDSDTPYTYHDCLGGAGDIPSPVLPGLTLLGTSGTIPAFRWLYAYRVSLISQKMMKGSLWSEAHRRFVPFIFFGVLVPRDAEILLDMRNLDTLRYRGNVSPPLEFCHLVADLIAAVRGREGGGPFNDLLDRRFPQA